MKISASSIPSALRLVLPLSALLLGATGCYEQNTRVVVFPDGSGRIVVTRSFPPATVRLIEMQSGMRGGMADNVRTEGMFFSEKQLKADATQLFGKGVRFISAQRMDQHGGRGSIALYAFDKIDKVVLQPSQLMQSAMRSVERNGGDPDEEETEVESEVVSVETLEPDEHMEESAVQEAEEGEESEAGPFGRHAEYVGNAAYRFKFQAGAQPKLTVLVPAALRPMAKDKKNAGEAESEDASMGGMDDGQEIPDESRQQLMANGNPLQLTGNETSQEIQLKVYKGMRFSIDVEVRGAAATMTATHPDARQAGRCTLLRVDAGEIVRAAGAKGLQAVQQIVYGQFGAMIGKPGVTTENQAEVAFSIKTAASSERGSK